jgi:hypothetical protein
MKCTPKVVTPKADTFGKNVPCRRPGIISVPMDSVSVQTVDISIRSGGS